MSLVRNRRHEATPVSASESRGLAQVRDEAGVMRPPQWAASRLKVITSPRDDLRAGRLARHDDPCAAFADPCAVLPVVIPDAPCRQSVPLLARTRPARVP